MVEFSIERPYRRPHHYVEEHRVLAEKLAEDLKHELNDILKAVVLFGSSAKSGSSTLQSDIDVLLIVNDLSIVLSPEVVESMRVIIENVASKISAKFHITSMRISEFWDYIKIGDPIVVNILRDGISLYDTGFFEPAQFLLEQGRIRPSKEGVWVYYSRAPQTLHNSRWHLVQATVDLYWAVIDSAHAALMHHGIVPPAPNHVADLLEKRLVHEKKLEKEYVKTMRLFYMLAKKVGHKQLTDITGKEYEELYAKAHKFVKRMRLLISE